MKFYRGVQDDAKAPPEIKKFVKVSFLKKLISKKFLFCFGESSDDRFDVTEFQQKSLRIVLERKYGKITFENKIIFKKFTPVGLDQSYSSNFNKSLVGEVEYLQRSSRIFDLQ